ncbi:MAG: cell division protein FtsZ [Prevotellaceae bacterium]|jgi:cell division protein FtsZ|nr:cell division protein FtsZ [Prevotellaceae bacterium]
MTVEKELIVPSGWNQQIGSIIKAIGVGGGGNNAVRNMYTKGIEGVDFVICNTDLQVLHESPIPIKIQLGKELTGGLGAGCDPETGREAAIEAIEEIRKVLEDNTKMVFISAGLGGGTGTGAGPIIAKEAKEKGILTVGIVTLPFEDEGYDARARAVDGLHKMKQHVDSLLVIDSEKIYDIYPDMSLFDALPKADDIVATAAKSIAEIITKRGYINIDFADVKRFMTDSGMALMGLGRASGEQRALKAVEQALNSPLLSDNNISGAKKILVNITSGTKKPIVASELRELMAQVKRASGGTADCKRGVIQDDTLDEEIAVTIIATGFSIKEYIDERRVYEEPQAVAPLKVSYEDDEFEDFGDGIRVKTVQLDVNDSMLSNYGPSATIENPTPKHVSGRFSIGQLKDADIAQLENIPAYERKNMKLNFSEKVSEGETIKFTLGERTGGKHALKENNAFLNRDVD